MPNAQVLEVKQAQVTEAVELIKNAQTGVLVDYRGLNVAEDTDLRNKLREANVKYFVIKNKILKCWKNIIQEYLMENMMINLRKQKMILKI